MPLEIGCPCLLCATEARLISNLASTESDVLCLLFSNSKGSRRFSSVPSLLLHLRTSPVDAQSDELLCELLTARHLHHNFIESLLVLAFLPMLHSTIRRVARMQSSLSLEDITQQVLSFLLQYLSSDDLKKRHSHLAFAISRAVKRKAFEWADRQNVIDSLQENFDVSASRLIEESFERHAVLRHFLHRALSKGLLSDDELNLLIEFKLEGYGARDFEVRGRGTSNALRQRLKRLLAKLRRIAQD